MAIISWLDNVLNGFYKWFITTMWPYMTDEEKEELWQILEQSEERQKK